MKKLLIAIVILGALAAIGYSKRAVISDWLFEMQKEALAPEAVSFEEVEMAETAEKAEGAEREQETTSEPQPIPEPTPEPPPEPEPTPAPEPEPASSELPAEFNLAVPFTSQAPNGDWSEPYQEACEETSLLMAHRYYQGEPGGAMDPAVADKAIWEVVNFENALFGYYQDTTAAQTVMVAEQLYGYERVELIEEPTIDSIKTHIAAGRPVIIPAAGQQLGNPYYTPPGPRYHMLVIKGYTEKGFITNDPGTRRGENYFYAFDTLMNAIHDWNGGEVESGAKVAFVIYPNE